MHLHAHVEAAPPLDPPLAPGEPLLGNARAILRDTGAFLVDAHARLGPVFRARVLWHEYVVIAGASAGDFLRDRLDEQYCSRHGFFAPIEREFGGADLTLAHSGERHRRLRRPLALAYSRQVASPFVPMFVEAAQRIARGWQPGSSHRVMPALQRLAFDQFRQAMAGDASNRLSFRDCLLVSEIGMNVGGRILPEAAFRLPWYRAAHRRAFRILREIVDSSATARAGFAAAEPTIIETLLSARDATGKLLTRDEAVTYAAYGIAASCAYVARLTAFMLYEILRDPELEARVTAESDALGTRGVRDATDVRRLPLLRAVFQETLRIHPISPGLPFTAEQDFTHGGYRIRKGDDLVLSPVPLAFSECPFHRPHTFDPARFDEPRAEHRKGNGFHPFGLGRRTCVATGLVELMAVTAVATLLRERALSLDPPGYELGLVIRPLPAPDRRFRVRVEARKGVPGPAAPAGTPVAATFAFLGGQDDPAIADAVQSASVTEFEPGARILREGGIADAFYVITRGSVLVTRGAGADLRQLAELSAGDCFGEVGLLQDAPRNADVTAGADGVSTIVLSREAFLEIVASSDLIAEEIGALARRRSADDTRR